MESWSLPDMSPLLRHFFKALHWISVPSFTTTMSRTQVSSDSSTDTLDSNSSSPNLFQQPPTFSQLCASLQRNDPLTTEIRTDHSSPDGYGRPLGENDLSRASQICLCADAQDSTPETTPLLQSLRTNPLLKKVSLRGLRYHYYGNVSYSHLSEPMLLAILENPRARLCHLKILNHANISMESLCRVFQETTSLQSLNVDFTNHYDAASLDLFLVALGLNQTLQRLTVRHRCDHDIAPT
jgi:hypothetical protein